MVNRVISFILVLAVVFGGGYYAYQRMIPDKTTEAEGPIFSTAPVTRGDIRVEVEGFGQLNPVWYSSLQAPAEGTIEAVHVARGQRVEPGQLVVTLRNDQIGYELQNLELEVEQMELELAEILGVPKEQAAYADPNRVIGIYAPISGRVTNLKFSTGDTVEEGQMICQIVDDSKLIMVAELTPGEADGVSAGSVALLQFQEFEGTVEARVTEVDKTPIPKGTHFVYRVTIEVENKGLLKPGQAAKLFLKTSHGTRAIEAEQKLDRYWRETIVVAKAKGTVARLDVKDMAHVKAGDRLITLGGEATRRYIEENQLKIKQKKLQISQKQDIRDKLEVRSDIAGTVAWIREQKGGRVQAGEPIASIFDASKMNLHFQADEMDVLHLKEGQEATVTVPALPGKTFKGKVLRVDMMGQTEEGFGQYGVFMEVEGTAELKPGMTANVSIFVGEKKGVLLVPIEAVFEDKGKTFVEVLRDGKPVPVEVKVGLSNDKVAEIESGLSEGEEVVTGSTLDRLEERKKEEPAKEAKERDATEGKNPLEKLPVPTKPVPKR